MLFRFSGAQQSLPYTFHHINPNAFGLKDVFGQNFDSKGRMWMVCSEGLAVYNGYTASVYRSDSANANSLLGKSIQSFLLDSNDCFWICYQDTSGISFFDPAQNTFTHYLPDSTRKDAAPAEMIVGFRQDSKKRLWVMTWDGGLYLLNKEKGTFKNWRRNFEREWDASQPAGNRIKVMNELTDGRFIVAFFSGGAPAGPPMFFDPEKEEFSFVPLEGYRFGTHPDEERFVRVALTIVHFIHTDEHGDYWVGTYSGLLHIQHASKTIRRVTGITQDVIRQNHENARSILVDERGHYWIATGSTGIMVVNPKNYHVKYIRHYPLNRGSVSDNRVYGMRKDREGNIWLSTGAGLLDIYSPVQHQFRILPWEDMNLDYSNRSAQVIPLNQMRVLSSREVYLSNQNGMAILNADSGVVDRVLDARIFIPGVNMESVIHQFRFIGDSLFFISKEYGVMISGKEKKIAYFDWRKQNWRGKLLLFRHGKGSEQLWMAIRTNRGASLVRYDPATLQSRDSIHLNEGCLPTEGFSFMLPSNRYMLACGPRMFAIVDPHLKKSIVFSPDSGFQPFPDSTILTACLSVDGKVYITSENGVYRFDEVSGKTELLNEQIGISNEAVYAIIQDKQGVFWMALRHEILRWDPIEKISFRFAETFGLNAGEFIPSIAQMDENGKIYITSVSGLVVFDPLQVKLPENRPRLYFSGLIAQSDTANRDQMISWLITPPQFEWNQNNIQVEYYSDLLFNIVPPKYEYRLVGMDSLWKDNGSSNRIRFTNLPHGTFTLEIRLTNAYGLQSDVLKWTFSIARPFWLAWWFYVLIAVALGGLVWIYIRYRESVLRERQLQLERKVEERTAEVLQKAEEIRLQKDIISEKNKELTDSIHYAQRIQQAMLPDDRAMKESMPDHFVLFKPKDIVSGDFYWHSHQPDCVLWAVVDCTGHGVPGGFMSMLGSGLLNQIVNEEKIFRPDQILNLLRERVIIALKQSGEPGEGRDGMDLGLVHYIPSKQQLHFAGAHNSLYIVRNGELLEYKADKQPIGIHGAEMKPFTLHAVSLQKGDHLYMSSDGYSDQFGGEKGKKFKSSNFELLLKTISPEPITRQHQILDETFTTWKGNFEQLDDVCVIGVRL
ncbi:MAG: two-component regulator propeller domain-containing protein [Flavobacteriales bacterium]